MARAMFDLVMIMITGGLWLVWMLIRYHRNNQKLERMRYYRETRYYYR